MSQSLFKQVTHVAVAEAIEHTPYLDLEWQFLDVKALAKQVDKAEACVPLGETFDVWISSRRGNARFILDLYPDDPYIRLDWYSEYVLGLTASDFTANYLIDLCRQYRDYVLTELIKQPQGVNGSLFSSLLLAPILKWRDSTPSIGSELLGLLEETLVTVSTELRRGYSPDLLNVANWLFFTYIIVADISKVGINSAIGNDLLRFFRTVSPSKWAGTKNDVRVAYAALMLAHTMRFYKLEEAFKTKHGFSYEILADLRSVFQDAGMSGFEAVFVPAQWVFRWLVDKLDCDVFSSFRRGEVLALATLSPVEQNLAVELTRRFAAYRVPVSIESFANFLLQFGTTQRIRGALRLLSHVKFYPLWELTQAIERTLAAELTRTGEKELVISAFGEHTGSAAIMNYLVAHSSLAPALKFEPNLTAALANTNDDDSIYIVDDCLLSGTQGLNTLADLMGTRQRKSHHTVHAPELSDIDKKRLERRYLKFTYGVVMDFGMKRFLGDEYAKTGLIEGRADVLFGTVESASSKIFEPLGPVGWLSEEERNEMKAFCEQVGYNILERRAHEKDWNDERRMESALGFSDMQRLLVFPYNVPKTTLTLLWERSVGEHNWRPLFPGFD